MGLRLFKLQLLYHNFSSKTVLIKIFLVATAMASIPCFSLIREIEPIEGCNSWKFPLPSLPPLGFFEKVPRNSTAEIPKPPSASDLDAVFRELMTGKWLTPGDKVLCVGRNSVRAVMVLRKLGFRNAIGVDKKGCSSLVRRGDLYGLPFRDGSFDFVFSRAIDSVRVPARLVLEMERVLRPGSVGVVFHRVSCLFPATAMMKVAAPVSSFLRFSDVDGVRTMNCSAMVVFKKRVVGAAPVVEVALTLASSS